MNLRYFHILKNATIVLIKKKMEQFHSLHKVHIRHKGAKFHTAKDHLPNQFHQPTSRYITVFGITQRTQHSPTLHEHNCNVVASDPLSLPFAYTNSTNLLKRFLFFFDYH